MFLDFGYIFQHFCSQTSAAPESLPQKKKNNNNLPWQREIMTLK